MATETKTFYPGAYNTNDYSYASISGQTNPVGKGSNNSSDYATINLKTGSNATTHTRWPFDCSTIPAGATIDSVSCKAAVSISSTSGVSTRTLQMHSGTTAKGSATTISGTSRTVYTLTCGSWTRDELQNCNLYIYAKRGTSSTSTSRNIRFYGADLTVTYTSQSEKFMLKLGGKYNDIARVFKKVSGIWVEQTDLANVIPDNVRYQNGGEIISPNKTVTITGSGSSSLAYVTINGKKYTAPATVSVPTGTVITCTVADEYPTVKTCYISVDGVKVVDQKEGSYNHTVSTSCTIALSTPESSSFSYGTITITTK